MTVAAMTTVRQVKRQQHLNKARSASLQGGRRDVPLPGATSLHTHSAKFPIEREVILTSGEKESAKIPILTEYMRKAKPTSVAPDAPNIHVAWTHHKSMENLAASSGMSHEIAGHQLYKAEPMALIDSSHGSEPSPIRPNDHINVYTTESGIATSTPEVETKGGFPSRTYHSIKDMISSRFSHKEKPPAVETNNTSLSPQSQLRQHGVYMGASASAQDLRHMGRTRNDNFGKGSGISQQQESVYQTPTSYRHHHHPPIHQQQVHHQQHHQQIQETNMAPPGIYTPQQRGDPGYNMPRTSYAQPEQDQQWHHQQAEVIHHHQQVRFNGVGYNGGPQPHTPVNRVTFNGTPGPSRFDHHHQQIHHHQQQQQQQQQQQHYSPCPPRAGQSAPHRSPRAMHQPLQNRPPSQGYQNKQVHDTGRQSPLQQVYQQSQEPERHSPSQQSHHLGKPPPDPGRHSPTIYQLGKPPPDSGRISPPPLQSYHGKVPSEIPRTSDLNEQSQLQQPTNNNVQQNNEGSSKPSARLQPCGQESSEPPVPDKVEISQSNRQEEVQTSEGTTATKNLNNTVEAKKTESIIKQPKNNQEHEDDDEGGFVKTGVQTDSGRGSTVYSSTKTKPSPEPGTANGGVGEWADLVETELRNILGPANTGANSTLSESISSVSPPLPPLSPAASSEDLNFRSRKKYENKSQASSSGWRSKGQHRSQATSGTKSSRNVISSSLEIDSMLDENNSSDDDLEYTDVRAIRKQLEGLETMYSQVLKLLGVKKHGSRYEASDPRVHKRRMCGSVSSVPSSVSSRPIRDKRRELRNKVRDIKGINKRFQRLESHVVTLARSVAHLSSEMRTQHLMMQEMEVIRSELASLRLQQQATRNSSPAKPTPDKVKKLTKFFGDEPPLLRLFLKQLGYEKYAPMFEKERIGLVELPYLTEERLHKLGIPLGPRLRIMQQAQFALATQHPNTLCIV